MYFSHFNDKGDIINFYEVLNVPFDADRGKIISSFRELIKYYHPDVSKMNGLESLKKVDLIIKGYKILSNDTLREEYNRNLFSKNYLSEDGLIFIPKKRIKYSHSLEKLLKSRLLNKKIRDKERLNKLGQHVEIFIMPCESKRGIISFVELPVRIGCPLCLGKNRDCYLCNGVARINSTSILKITVPPPIEHETYLDFDLMTARPDTFTYFTMKSLRVKLSIIGKKTAAGV